MNIYADYNRIMELEDQMKCGLTDRIFKTTSTIFHTSAHELSQQIYQLVEVAKNSLVPRSYIKKYGLSDTEEYAIARDSKKIPILHESVAAHTNLLCALVDRAITLTYGPDFGEPGCDFERTSDGYTYREIMEAIRLHDLPENDIGDIPDDGSFNEEEKSLLELEYYKERIYSKYAGRDYFFKHRVFKLIEDMHSKKQSTGRLLYVADKTAAILMALVYDSLGLMPTIDGSMPELSRKDVAEIGLCDFEYNGHYKASEIWTIDFFHIRKINELDDTNFFTAIIVLYTLIVNGRWYDWREDDYNLYLS